MEKCILVTSFGNRDLEGIIANIRHWTSLPIVVFSETKHNVDAAVRIIKPQWEGHPRKWARNSDYWRAAGMLELKYDTYLHLDDDMRIVSPDFVQGFSLAEKFGFCLPISSRSFVDIDIKIAADTLRSEEVEIPKATACCTAAMFACLKKPNIRFFFEKYIEQMIKQPETGPMVFARTIQQTGIHPYILPEEWCICEYAAKRKYTYPEGHQLRMLIEPIILHIGHPSVKQWFRTDPLFEAIR